MIEIEKKKSYSKIDSFNYIVISILANTNKIYTYIKHQLYLDRDSEIFLSKYICK